MTAALKPLSAYNDPEYRAARRQLKAHPDIQCWECGQPAVTPDHQPALHEHDHRRGTPCCRLLPHCRACSNKQGAGITNTRLTPLKHWFG